MLDNYDRGEVTPPPVSSYGGSPGLLALHSSLYATPTSRAYDIESNIDGNDSSMPIDTQIISVRLGSVDPARTGETVPLEIGSHIFHLRNAVSPRTWHAHIYVLTIL